MTDILTLVQFVVNLLLSFPQSIVSWFVYSIVSLLYPIILALNIIYSDVNYIYTVVIQFANVFIRMPKWAGMIVTNWTPSAAPTGALAESSLSIPFSLAPLHPANSAYTLLSVAALLLSIGIECVLSLVYLVVWVYKKIPFGLGGH